jgi:hypothetical protein
MTDIVERLKFGTRVRAKTRTICGWKGTGTHLYNGTILKDGTNSRADYEDFELARMRDQTPNKEHLSLLERARG